MIGYSKRALGGRLIVLCVLGYCLYLIVQRYEIQLSGKSMIFRENVCAKTYQGRYPLFELIQQSGGFYDWCAKYQRTNTSYTNTTDKHWVKSYIHRIVPNLKIAKEYAWVSDAEDISDTFLSKLPNEYIMKPNHLSGTVATVIGRKVNCHNICPPNISTIIEPVNVLKSICKKWLATKFDLRFPKKLREVFYSLIPPKCIFEEFLGKDSVPEDYKVFTFHGEPYFIQTDSKRYKNHQIDFYTPKWKRINMSVGFPKPPPEEAPVFLKDMLAMARSLARPFPMMRVDFFGLEKTFAFAELTATPGNCIILYRPLIIDRFYGYIAGHKHADIDPEDVLLLT